MPKWLKTVARQQATHEAGQGAHVDVAGGGRRSFSEIAKSLDQGESTVRFRFKRPVDRGVIKSDVRYAIA
jgi:hypothetical protein